MKSDKKYFTLYSERKAKEIEWLWYPYIAIGKITLLQGNPGDGKSTMMMNIIASLSKGEKIIDTAEAQYPAKVLYQCSEDGLDDTIVPRLIKAGANCNNIAFIDEDIYEGISIDDERLRITIEEFKPKLVVIDPIQAYISNVGDMQSVGKARKLMKKLGIWADRYRCAVVLIGHMNKRSGGNEMYRGLGSIDLNASARIVLQIEQEDEEPKIMKLVQIKNNLAPKSGAIYYRINEDEGFKWLQYESELLNNDMGEFAIEIYKTKAELAVSLIRSQLSEGDTESEMMLNILKENGISERTARRVKEDMGVTAYQKNRKWYWSLGDK